MGKFYQFDIGVDFGKIEWEWINIRIDHLMRIIQTLLEEIHLFHLDVS